MSLSLPKKSTALGGDDKPPFDDGFHLRSWLLSWEVYFIVLIAAFLRLYRINTTEFDGDQANIFRMAYDALHSGMLVATANGASIHILNPPGIIYILMLTAAISANPLWSAVLLALSSTVAVLQTYIFTRRYYGRFAGTIAALLFAVAARAVFYSRFIWQQNFVPFFLLLFLLALFWGVVERRKGWLFPAIFLVGLLIQLHATGGLLIAPLLVALVLSPKTVRWRDLILGALSLFVLYLPYLLWEISTNFADINILLNQSKLPSQIDTLALSYYQLSLSPYATLLTNGEPFTNARSVLFPLYRMLFWLQPLLTFLLLAGAVAALVISLSRSSASGASDDMSGGDRYARQPVENVLFAFWRSAKLWWNDLRAHPYRCGLLVLLVWQIVPLLVLSRHALPIYPHYLIIFMPGQYILIGFFVAQVVKWCQRYRRWATLARVALSVLSALLVLALLLGSGAMVLDSARGNFSDRALSSPYYNDLRSLQDALRAADELAQQRHYNRVYISTDRATTMALTFLAGRMQTPTTLFDGARCAVLPDPAAGPAVMLVGPRNPFTSALVGRFAQATLVKQLARLGGPPFQLYIVNSVAQQATSTHAGFQDHLQALDAGMRSFDYHNAPWLVARWRLLTARQPDFRVTYGYTLEASSGSRNAQGESSQCAFSAIRSGDQLLVAFPQSSKNMPTSLTIQAQFYTILPHNLVYGPLAFETDSFLPPRQTPLHTINGQNSLTLSIANNTTN